VEGLELDLASARAELTRQKSLAEMALRAKEAELGAAAEQGRVAEVRAAEVREQAAALERSLEVASLAAREELEVACLAARDEERSRADAAEAERARAEEQLEASAAGAAAAREARDAAREEAREARAAAAAGEERMLELRGAERAMSEALDAHRREEARLRREVDAADAAAAEQSRELQAAAAKLERLERERTELQRSVAAHTQALQQARGGGGVESLLMLPSEPLLPPPQPHSLPAPQPVPADPLAPLPSLSSSAAGDGGLLGSLLADERASPSEAGPPHDETRTVASGERNSVEKLFELAEENVFLKAELAELQRSLARSESGVNLTFLKNVVVRYLLDGDLPNTLPVLAKVLARPARHPAPPKIRLH